MSENLGTEEKQQRLVRRNRGLLLFAQNDFEGEQSAFVMTFLLQCEIIESVGGAAAHSQQGRRMCSSSVHDRLQERSTERCSTVIGAITSCLLDCKRS